MFFCCIVDKICIFLGEVLLPLLPWTARCWWKQLTIASSFTGNDINVVISYQFLVYNHSKNILYFIFICILRKSEEESNKEWKQCSEIYLSKIHNKLWSFAVETRKWNLQYPILLYSAFLNYSNLTFHRYLKLLI